MVLAYCVKVDFDIHFVNIRLFCLICKILLWETLEYTLNNSLYIVTTLCIVSANPITNGTVWPFEKNLGKSLKTYVRIILQRNIVIGLDCPVVLEEV